MSGGYCRKHGAWRYGYECPKCQQAKPPADRREKPGIDDRYRYRGGINIRRK